ncbi:hypothetical protein ACCUM_0731 [Candidatus Accumulibacter phosphatis]|uniref:Uncharacterized protein n=1 Tax=Candidatus Accumulibacter phosphatis TaxID=327160 RepID=A0A5S4ETN0_9PROT|nr:hypothetical protein ACCUM_0731 [Candidatus Accumulibacter phosphatis]
MARTGRHDLAPTTIGFPLPAVVPGVAGMLAPNRDSPGVLY